MISLNPGSLCDVCAEEYGPHNQPHSIPCGHVMCLHCCNNILEKTSPRLAPSCPFCRVPFTSDTIRLIRVDFGSSVWSAPRKVVIEAPDSAADVGSDDDVLLYPGSGNAKTEARRLQDKVFQVAAKKCSLEEVTTLQQELHDWLRSDVKRDEAASLRLSAALLHAIVVNHMAHTRTSEMAKKSEAHLKQRLDEVQAAKEQAEAELLRLNAQYAAKAQEVQTLRAELNRSKIRVAAPALGVPMTPPPSSLSAAQQNGPLSPPRPQTTAPVTSPIPRSRATSPTSPTRPPHIPSMQYPLSRASASGHMRSASTVPGHRSMTPAARPASAIPAPAFAAAAIPGRRARLSAASPPPKMARSGSSSSDEKERDTQKDRERDRERQRHQLIQFWMPSIDAAASSPPSSKFAYQHPAAYHAAAAALPARHKTPMPAHPQ